MHTARDSRTDLPPPFRQAGTVGDDGLTLSICLRCRDGREDRNTDLDQRGGRRLAHAVADAFPDSTAASRGIRLRGVNCMSNCKRPCTIALSGPGRFTYLFGRSRPDAPCRRRPLRCRRLCRSRGRLSAQARATGGSARRHPRPHPATRLRGRLGRTALPDTPNIQLTGATTHEPFPFVPKARRGRHCGRDYCPRHLPRRGGDDRSDCPRLRPRARRRVERLGAREPRHRRATVPRVPRGRVGAAPRGLGHAERRRHPDRGTCT